MVREGLAGVLTALLLVVVAAGRASAAELPRVVVSLKPIHALVAAVMAGAGTPALLVEGTASEHIHALRPSEADAIARADLAVWVGPVMESYFVQPFQNLPRQDRVLTLIDLEGLTRLPFREGGPFEAHDGHAREGAKGSLAFDGHIWLDPENAAVVADAVAAALARIDPERAGLYASNAAALRVRLDALDGELRQRLMPLRTRPIIVFHDAYQYFEARYGLTVVGSVTVSPGSPASAARVRRIRARIKDESVACIFAEPQFEPKLVKTLAEGTGARWALLDPIGADLPPGAEQYFQLLRGLVRSLESCLAPQ